MKPTSNEYLKNCPVCGEIAFAHYLNSHDYFYSNEEFTIVQCQNCGFRFTNPRPKESTANGYYDSDKYISHNNSTRSAFDWMYQLVRKITIQNKVWLIRKNHPGTRILDIGCGTGDFLGEMNKAGFKAEGIEPNHFAGKIASEKYSIKVHEKFYPGLFPEDSFDVITFWHVLEHIYSLHETMHETRRVLNDQGVVFIALPNSDSWDAQHYEKFWAGYDLPRHIYHFTTETAQRVFDTCGFSVTKILPMYFDAFYISFLSEKYKKGKIRLLHGVVNGLWSNISASFQKNKFSSFIYILKKK